MSYSDRLTASSTMKPKQSIVSGGNKTPSSSSSTSTATTAAASPGDPGSKSLVNRVPPGLPKAPSKSKSKSPGPSITRKRASSTNPPKKYLSPPPTPTDDLTSAVILKKKMNPSKNTVLLGTSRNISSSSSSSGYSSKTSQKETKKAADEKHKFNLGILKTAKVVAAAKQVHEGPMEFPDENFDFYRILARPKVWDEEEDYISVKPSEHAKDRFSRKVKPSPPSHIVNRKESEIWGSMRTSSPGESSIPSLTSILDEDTKAKEVLGSVYGSGVEIRRDENNNVLATIKNTIFGSLSLFDASRNDDDDNDNERKDAVDLVVVTKSQLTHSSPMKEEGQGVKEQGCKEEINLQSSSHNNNIFNSVPISLSPVDGQLLLQHVEKSGLIPQKIEEQLHKEFHVDTLTTTPPCQENPLPSCLSKSEKSESKETPLTNISPLPALNPTEAADEMEDPRSLQLAFDASVSEEKEEQFHDVGCECSSSFSSIVSNNSYYVEDAMSLPSEELESHETQTQIVDYQDVETGMESVEELKKKKMMRFAMAVNSGIDIAPVAEPKKKSVRIKGIMKMNRPETPCSVPSTSSISTVVEEAIRMRAIQERNRPTTCAQLGADYGFPSDISISGFIGNLVPSKWAVGESSGKDNDVASAAKENVSHTHITFDEGDKSRSFMGTAYDILSAGLRYASSLIGDEAELEPREDTVHYNGYKIKVFGRKLLLESLHVNCDFNMNSSNAGSSCGCRNPSSSSMKPQALSRERESLEQSCDGRRIRIVIRFTGPTESKVEDANSIMDVEHNIQFGEGTWTFEYGNSNDNSRDNFVDIFCPTGVHPEYLAYGMMNDLLFIDAP